jgi:hypothetical protein
VELFAAEVATVLLVGTPVLVFVKLVQMLAAQRLTFARRGSRGAKAESVGWLLLAAVDSHTLALWSTFANQPMDLCGQYRPDLGNNVHIASGGFFDFPRNAQCVWPEASVAVTPWPLNVFTALFFAAAVAVTTHAAVRAYRRSHVDCTSSELR